MSEQELTPWQSIVTAPPTRPGIYNVSCRNFDQSGDWFGHFDGECWGGWETIDRAGGWKKLVRSVVWDTFRSTPEKVFGGRATWRGLANPPKAKP